MWFPLTGSTLLYPISPIYTSSLPTPRSPRLLMADGVMVGDLTTTTDLGQHVIDAD